METYKPVLINLPIPLLSQLDSIAARLNLSRSELLRRSLRRDLTFIAGHELRHFDKAQRNTTEDYSNWSSQYQIQSKE